MGPLSYWFFIFLAVPQELVWAARTTSSQRGCSPSFTSLTSHYRTRALQSPNELRSLLLHPHICVCARALVFLHGPNQEFGRPDSSWQGDASAVCVGLLLKPLAESFQSSRTVLRFCCWSGRRKRNHSTEPGFVRKRTVVLRPNWLRRQLEGWYFQYLRVFQRKKKRINMFL